MVENVQFDNEKDQQEAARLCPAWRKKLLELHGVMMQVAEFLETPKNWVFEQLNGTAEWKEHEAALDKRAEIL